LVCLSSVIVCLRKKDKILLYIAFIPLLPLERARFVTAKRDRFNSPIMEWFLYVFSIDEDQDCWRSYKKSYIGIMSDSSYVVDVSYCLFRLQTYCQLCIFQFSNHPLLHLWTFLNLEEEHLYQKIHADKINKIKKVGFC
jgi:hypothetical protein